MDAIRALGKIGDNRAVEPIINDVNNNGSSLEAIYALGELGGSAALSALLNMLRGKERWTAAKALGMMGSIAVEPLAALLKDKAVNKQGLIAYALGYTGTFEAVKPLLCALKDDDPVVSWRAATALIEIGDKRAIKYLQELVEKEDSEILKHVSLGVLQRLQPETVQRSKGAGKNKENDFFVLEAGVMERAFRATLAEDILYLSWKDALNLLRGDMSPPIPVSYRYNGGKTVPYDFIWTDYGFLVSERIVELFNTCNFTGWMTYPIGLYGKDGDLIKGYQGFAFTSRVSSVDYSRSEIVAKQNPLFTKPNIVKKGIYFDENSWDGSDVFFAGYFLVTGRVVETLQRVRPKVKNWHAIPASKYEIPLILDEVELGLLTDEDRDKVVNELRRSM